MPQSYGVPSPHGYSNTTSSVTIPVYPATTTKPSYTNGTTTSVITETSTFPVTQTITTYVPCSTSAYVTSGTTYYSTSLSMDVITTTYTSTQTRTITDYPATTPTGSSEGSYPGSPINDPSDECHCAEQTYVTVTETIYSSEGYAPATYPAGPLTTETITATMGNGHTTCIVITHPASTVKPTSPPYPIPSGHSDSVYPQPTGSAAVRRY